jgi:hypothetical protein
MLLLVFFVLRLFFLVVERGGGGVGMTIRPFWLVETFSQLNNVYLTFPVS